MDVGQSVPVMVWGDAVSWQPIDTFPHLREKWADGYGLYVLLSDGKTIEIGRPNYDHSDDGTPQHNQCDPWFIGSEAWSYIPTHWQPLPPLPGAICDHA